MTPWSRWRYNRETRRLTRDWLANAETAKTTILPPTATEQGNADLRKMLTFAIDELRRLADPTEMSGSGETETMTGPAACELRCRMNKAARAVEWLTPRATIRSTSDRRPDASPFTTPQMEEIQQDRDRQQPFKDADIKEWP